MGRSALGTIEACDRRAWRAWLAKHHSKEAGVWLLFRKGDAGKKGLAYEDAVEEAICFGWVDSLVKRIDDDHYARKFTPRKPDGPWSTINRRRYESLKARGLLTRAGRARPPTDKSGDLPDISPDELPTYIENALRRKPAAWSFFRQLAPSYRKTYIYWIDSAKRDQTKKKRLERALEMLAAGRKPR